MEKLIGRNLNISVFISGRGSNLLSLIKYSKNKNSKIKINLIISNNKFSKGLEFAKKNKVRIAIETEGSYKKKDVLLMQKPEEYKKLLKYFKPKELGINLNLGHLNLASKAFKFSKSKFNLC